MATNATSGITIAQTRAGIDAYLATHVSKQPQWVIVALGSNDMLEGMPSETQQEADLGYILDACRAKWPQARAMLLKVWIPGHDADATTLATRIDHVVAARASWAVAGPVEHDFLPGHIDVDGVHPDATGYDLMGQAIATALGYWVFPPLLLFPVRRRRPVEIVSAYWRKAA